jgi:hypothetical protein
MLFTVIWVGFIISVIDLFAGDIRAIPIYWFILFVELTLSVIFSITVYKTWQLYSTQKYLRKNEPSMIAKLVIQYLSAVSIIFAAILWNTLGKSFTIENKKLVPYSKSLLVLAVVEMCSIAFNFFYLWWLTNLKISSYLGT